MTNERSNWKNLLNSINSSGKFVTLDLSDCIMDGTVFNPDRNFSLGKNYIISIILPDVAQTMPMSYYNSTIFDHFTVLKSITAENLTSIPQLTFENLTSLINVSFPNVTNIHGSAFDGCTNLISISFPAKATVGSFSGCYNLTSFDLIGTGNLSVIEGGKVLVRNGTELIAYPSATGSVTLNGITRIGSSAFANAINLTYASFPDVTHINRYAFYGCRNLVIVLLPNVRIIGESGFMNGGVFAFCTNLINVSLPVVEIIYGGAFAYCTNLNNISFPASATVPYRGGENLGSTFYGTNINSFFLIGDGNLESRENGRALVQNLTDGGISLIAYPTISGDVILNYLTRIEEGVIVGVKNITCLSIPNVLNTDIFGYTGWDKLTSVTLAANLDVSGIRGNFRNVYNGAGTYIWTNSEWIKQ